MARVHELRIASLNLFESYQQHHLYINDLYVCLFSRSRSKVSCLEPSPTARMGRDAQPTTATIVSSQGSPSPAVHTFPVTPSDSEEEITMLRTLRNPAAAASAGTRTLPRLEKPLTQAAVKLNSQTLQEMPPSLCRSINQSRAEYRRLGNSGLRISNPILGGMHIGTSKWFDWVLDEGQAIALLKEAYDRGINTVSSDPLPIAGSD